MAAVVVYQFKLDVLLVAAHDLAGAVVIHMVGAAHGLLVVGPEGLKLLEVGKQFVGDVLKTDDSIDVEDGLGLCRLYVLLYVGLEPALELLHMFGLHAQTSGIGVTAKILQQVAAAGDGTVHVKACHRTGRSCGHVLVAGEHYGRPVIDFREAGGYNADDSLVPFFVVDDDGLLLLVVEQLKQKMVGQLGHGIVQVLPLIDIMIE